MIRNVFSHLILFTDTTLKKKECRLKHALETLPLHGIHPAYIFALFCFNTATGCPKMYGGKISELWWVKQPQPRFGGEPALGKEGTTLLKLCLKVYKWNGSSLLLYNKKSSAKGRMEATILFCCKGVDHK